jgi:hypothetical protein
MKETEGWVSVDEEELSELREKLPNAYKRLRKRVTEAVRKRREERRKRGETGPVYDLDAAKHYSREELDRILR